MVSIIIPHYNRSLLLKQTIDSVKVQTYNNWEIIIVDDGSEEIEWKTIETYEAPNIKIIKRKDGQKGPSRCRNIGVSKSLGKYLLFLDSDDLLANFCLQQRVREMEKSDKADLAIFLMGEFINVPGDTNRNYNTVVPFNELSGKFLKAQNPWNVTCPIWKKEFFEKVGGFDERFFFMEDPDLHLRAINTTGAKIKICYDAPADCYYRINHMDNTKQNFWFNSIFYRILFYKKLTEKNYSRDFIFNNVNDVKIGVYDLVKTFLYSRKRQFPELSASLLNWMKECKLFSLFEIVRLKCLIDLGNSSLWIFRKLKIKGICFRLLPVK